MYETIFIVVCIVVGFAVAVVALSAPRKPGLTPENRAEVARGLFEHFEGEARAEIARYYPEEAQDGD